MGFSAFTVDDPMMKAMTSVIEVTVIETPACFNIIPTFSGSGRFLQLSSSSFQHVIITNMSSTP